MATPPAFPARAPTLTPPSIPGRSDPRLIKRGVLNGCGGASRGSSGGSDAHRQRRGIHLGAAAGTSGGEGEGEGEGWRAHRVGGCIPRARRAFLLGAAGLASLGVPWSESRVAVADVEGVVGTDDVLPAAVAVASSSSSLRFSPLECAADPACVNERGALVSSGAYVPPTEYSEEDPDGALRRSICPRNPTADICRSVKDRNKVNDSKCKIPIGLGCALWKK